MFIDLHCDTVSRLKDNPGGGTLLKNTFDLDFFRMRKAGCIAQVFALFCDAGGEENREKLLSLYNFFMDELRSAKGFAAFAGSFRDFEENRKKGLISAFLSIEDAGIFGCDIAFLPALHRMGVWSITLTWNYKNALGLPAVLGNESGSGLTPAGFLFLEELNRLCILPDISHLNDMGAADVLRHSKGPVLASHSNARGVFNHRRNVSDSIIRGIGNSGGLVGLNFYSPFLSESPRASVSDVARHARHIANTGGIGVLALGSDFDGMGGDAAEISSVEKLPLLADALKKSGFSESEIDGIFHKNTERLIHETPKRP